MSMWSIRPGCNEMAQPATPRADALAICRHAVVHPEIPRSGGLGGGLSVWSRKLSLYFNGAWRLKLNPIRQRHHTGR